MNNAMNDYQSGASAMRSACAQFARRRAEEADEIYKASASDGLRDAYQTRRAEALIIEKLILEIPIPADPASSEGADTQTLLKAEQAEVIRLECDFRMLLAARDAEIAALRAALIEIRDANQIEMALDPGWAARIAMVAIRGKARQ
jgi:hypothetical protein